MGLPAWAASTISSGEGVWNLNASGVGGEGTVGLADEEFTPPVATPDVMAARIAARTGGRLPEGAPPPPPPAAGPWNPGGGCLAAGNPGGGCFKGGPSEANGDTDAGAGGTSGKPPGCCCCSFAVAAEVALAAARHHRGGLSWTELRPIHKTAFPCVLQPPPTARLLLPIGSEGRRAAQPPGEGRGT